MGYYILCPYHVSEKRHTISCEDSLHVFYSQNEKKNWISSYCTGDWERCVYAQGLNEIYEKEDEMSDWMKRAKLAERKAKTAREELKNLNREYGKRAAELDAALQAKEAARKAAEHIVSMKYEQIKQLQEQIAGWRQLHEIDKMIIACLMNEQGIKEFDVDRTKAFKKRYEFSLTGGKDGTKEKVIKLHIKEKE